MIHKLHFQRKIIENKKSRNKMIKKKLSSNKESTVSNAVLKTVFGKKK
jgi:hypothetical protein